MDVDGSPGYVLIWKIWDMPLGEPICALRASARETYVKDYIGLLPTATCPVKTNGHQAGNNRYVTAIQRRFGGRINPGFVLWQMGFSREWLLCGVVAMQSIRTLGRNLSTPLSKCARK